MNLIRRVIVASRRRSKRAAISLGLLRLLGGRRRRDVLDREGTGWEGDLSRMRSSRVRRI